MVTTYTPAAASAEWQTPTFKCSVCGGHQPCHFICINLFNHPFNLRVPQVSIYFRTRKTEVLKGWRFCEILLLKTEFKSKLANRQALYPHRADLLFGVLKQFQSVSIMAWDSLGSPGCPKSHGDPPASTSPMLRLGMDCHNRLMVLSCRLLYAGAFECPFLYPSSPNPSFLLLQSSPLLYRVSCTTEQLQLFRFFQTPSRPPFFTLLTHHILGRFCDNSGIDLVASKHRKSPL